jgi:hypothetical protein
MHPGRKLHLGLMGAALLILALLAAGTAATLARSPDQGYNLSWHTVDGGGYTWNTGGTYTLGGTIGQPDAGAWAGGAYTLVMGFWGGSRGEEGLIFLPLIVRQY